MASLTKSQIKKLKLMINDRFTELLEEVRQELIRSDDQHYVDLAGRVTDVGDESVADMLVDMDAAIVDRQIREIRDLDAARLRIGDFSYGICADCGEDIGYKRLLAYPAARRCYACQQQHEKSYAQEGRPSL